MADGYVFTGLMVLMILAPVGMAAWVAMLWFPLWLIGINLRDKLQEIELAEAVLFGLYAVGAAHVVSGLFSRFV